MNKDMVVDLVWLTLRNPTAASERILGLQLGRNILWPGLILASALNTIFFSLGNLLFPAAAAPGFFASPLAMFVLLTGVLVLTIHALFWTGKMLGGEGELGDLLALMVWLQALRVLVQIAVIVLLLIAPMMSVLASLIAGVWGIWILLNFIKVAFRFPSLGKAAGVLLIATVGLVFGLLFLASVVGLTSAGGIGSV